MTSRRVSALTIALLLLATLAYLRDPAWLIDVDSGFRPWERATDGTRYRWTGGHASFFVPSGRSSLAIPVRTTFAPGDSPVAVTVSIDDRPAAVAELRDDKWRLLTVNPPGPRHRRVTRIDIHVDRLRAGNRGVAVGEVEGR